MDNKKNLGFKHFLPFAKKISIPITTPLLRVTPAVSENKKSDSAIEKLFPFFCIT